MKVRRSRKANLRNRNPSNCRNLGMVSFQEDEVSGNLMLLDKAVRNWLIFPRPES
jgi:hypothetical protein